MIGFSPVEILSWRSCKVYNEDKIYTTQSERWNKKQAIITLPHIIYILVNHENSIKAAKCKEYKNIPNIVIKSFKYDSKVSLQFKNFSHIK